MRLPTTHLPKSIPLVITISALVISVVLTGFLVYQDYTYITGKSKDQKQQIDSLTVQLNEVSAKLTALESEDQYQTNQQLKKDIAATHKAFAKAKVTYEKIQDAKIQVKNNTFDKDFAQVLNDLSDLKYASAESKLAKIDTAIDAAVLQAQALKGIDIANVTLAAAPPESGYRRQKVAVDGQEFVVDIVTGDLGSTRVIVDTASNETCANDCPVLSLGDYVARNGAYAGINGSYFCPASYPSCAGKTNSFDLLLMNKNKVYFNSDNNVYSTNPAVIFNGGSVRFVGSAQEWGRDTGIDSMLSNYPLLLMNSEVRFGGNDDAKMSGAGSRAFVASKGNTVYIGVIRGVSVQGAAKVLKAMGMEHAMNLDSGGSIALWANGGYKAGPGRAIPNAILFVRK